VNVPLEVAQRVIEAATESDGIKIASASGLAALKLFRLSMRDKADLAALVKTGRVNVDGFALPSEADPERIRNDLASHFSTLALKGRGGSGAVIGGKRRAVA
jgi:hypothetical protein